MDLAAQLAELDSDEPAEEEESEGGDLEESDVRFLDGDGAPAIGNDSDQADQADTDALSHDGDDGGAEAYPDADGQYVDANAYPDTDGQYVDANAYPDTDGQYVDANAYPDTDGQYVDANTYPGTDGQYVDANAYPGTDGQYVDANTYPDTDGQYVDANAYPDTDGQYVDANAYPGTDGQYVDANAYPDTDGQYVDANAYPDTDGQYVDANAYPDAREQFEDSSASLSTNANRGDNGGSSHVSSRSGEEGVTCDVGITRGGLNLKEERYSGRQDYTQKEATVAERHGLHSCSDASDQAGAPQAKPSAPAPKPAWRPPDWSKLPLMHQPKIEAYEDGVMKRSMSLARQTCYLLGRNGQHADVVLEHDSISRVHCAIINSSSSTFVQDLDSFHGTFLDVAGRTVPVPKLGERLVGGAEPTKLVDGATIRLGNCRTVYRIVGLTPQQLHRWHPPSWCEHPARKVSLEVRSNTYANPYLAHLAEDGADFDELLPLTTRRVHIARLTTRVHHGQCMLLTAINHAEPDTWTLAMIARTQPMRMHLVRNTLPLRRATVFGRSSAHADVVVRDESISRQHAAIVHADRESFIIDLGSASGSFVDGVQIPKNQTRKLHDGSVIQLGNSKATYTLRVPKSAAGVQHGGGKRKR